MKPLVSAEQLRAELEACEQLVLVDVSYRLGDADFGREHYDQGHLPGAVFCDLETELCEPVAPGVVGGRHPLPTPERLREAMRRAGVSSSSRVVAYDQANSLAASRLWWLLRDAGHDDVRVLDGGLAAWQRAGGATTTEPFRPAPGDFLPAPAHLPVVDADGAARLVSRGHRLVDVRAAERFRGETEPIDPVAGHVPGSENIPVTALQDDRGCFLAPEVVADRLAGLGRGDAMSCGSGITASLALLGAEHAGITGVGLYAGSWSDWTSDPSRPVATGEAGGKPVRHGAGEA